MRNLTPSRHIRPSRIEIRLFYWPPESTGLVMAKIPINPCPESTVYVDMCRPRARPSASEAFLIKPLYCFEWFENSTRFILALGCTDGSSFRTWIWRAMRACFNVIRGCSRIWTLCFKTDAKHDFKRPAFRARTPPTFFPTTTNPLESVETQPT